MRDHEDAPSGLYQSLKDLPVRRYFEEAHVCASAPFDMGIYPAFSVY